jgi:hypothetical protein
MARTVFRIEHRLGIAAPDHVIWEVLSDLERWPEWNPMYSQASGRLRIGEKLTLTDATPGLQPEVITPSIIDWVPDTQILWGLSQKAGFQKRLRYLEIEKLSDHGCVFANGEDWAGYMAKYVPVRRRRAIRNALEAMSEALRDRAVALWRQRGGSPTSG